MQTQSILFMALFSLVVQANENDLKFVDAVFPKDPGPYSNKPTKQRVKSLAARARAADDAVLGLQRWADNFHWQQLATPEQQKLLLDLVPDSRLEGRVERARRRVEQRMALEVLRQREGGGSASAGIFSFIEDEKEPGRGASGNLKKELESSFEEARKIQRAYRKLMKRLPLNALAGIRDDIGLGSTEPIDLPEMRDIRKLAPESLVEELASLEDQYRSLPHRDIVTARLVKENLKKIGPKVDGILREIDIKAGHLFTEIVRDKDAPLHTKISVAEGSVRRFARMIRGFSSDALERVGEIDKQTLAVERRRVGLVGLKRFWAWLSGRGDVDEGLRRSIAKRFGGRVARTLVGAGLIGAASEIGINAYDSRTNARIPRVGDAQVGGKK